MANILLYNLRFQGVTIMRRACAVFLLIGGPPALAQGSGKSRYDLLNPTPRALLREMSTDRPDKTESPFTVDAGHIQVELDFVTYTSDRSRRGGEDIRSETVNVAPINFKLGLTNSTDLQVVFDSYLRETVTDHVTRTREKAQGIGDLTVRLKQNLWGNDGGTTALALMPFVKLPTNTNGFGNDAVEFGVIVPLAITVSDRVGVGLMTKVDPLRKSDGKSYRPSFINSATVAFTLTNKLGLYTELFTERGTERGARWNVTGDVGLTYAVSENIQLDTGVNLGITEAADDLNLFVGLSRRF
jgi:hypothetical protein